MSQNDRPTPPDPHRPAQPPRPRAKAPSRPEAAPAGADTLADVERAKREALSALRRVGAQRAQLPPAPPYRPRQETLRDSPAPPPSGSLPPPSSSNADQHTISALRREIEAYRQGRKTSPPGGTPAQQQPKAEAADDEIDRTTGKLMRLLLRRYWFQGALALGIAGVALKPAAQPQQVDASAARIEALEAQHAALSASHSRALAREAGKDNLIKCLHDQDAERFAQLFPAKDKAGSAMLPQPWVDRCAHFKLP